MEDKAASRLRQAVEFPASLGTRRTVDEAAGIEGAARLRPPRGAEDISPTHMPRCKLTAVRFPQSVVTPDSSMGLILRQLSPSL